MFITEFSARAEMNIVSKVDEKRTKYQELLGHLRRLWPDYAGSLLVMVIGSLGGLRNTGVPFLDDDGLLLAVRSNRAWLEYVKGDPVLNQRLNSVLLKKREDFLRMKTQDTVQRPFPVPGAFVRNSQKVVVRKPDDYIRHKEIYEEMLTQKSKSKKNGGKMKYLDDDGLLLAVRSNRSWLEHVKGDPVLNKRLNSVLLKKREDFLRMKTKDIIQRPLPVSGTFLRNSQKVVIKKPDDYLRHKEIYDEMLTQKTGSKKAGGKMKYLDDDGLLLAVRSNRSWLEHVKGDPVLNKRLNSVLMKKREDFLKMKTKDVIQRPLPVSGMFLRNSQKVVVRKPDDYLRHKEIYDEMLTRKTESKKAGGKMKSVKTHDSDRSPRDRILPAISQPAFGTVQHRIGPLEMLDDELVVSWCFPDEQLMVPIAVVSEQPFDERFV
nr:unnamed protein product [Callosobruchus chinensis]